MEDEYDEGYVLVEKPEAAAGDAAADVPPAPSTPLLNAEKTVSGGASRDGRCEGAACEPARFLTSNTHPTWEVLRTQVAPAPTLQPGVLEVVSAGLCAWLLLVAERGGRCWAAVKQVCGVGGGLKTGRWPSIVQQQRTWRYAAARRLCELFNRSGAMHLLAGPATCTQRWVGLRTPSRPRPTSCALQAAALAAHDATHLVHRYARAIQAHDWQGLRALAHSQLLRIAHTVSASWRAARSAAATYCHSAASLAAWALHHPSQCGRCMCHALGAAYSRVDPHQRLPRAAAHLAQRTAELWHKADPDGKVGKAFHSYVSPALSLAAHRTCTMVSVARHRVAVAWGRMAPVLQRAWARARRTCVSRGSSWLLVVAVAMGVLAIFIDTMLDL